MYLSLLHKAFLSWRTDHVPRMAASLSYYTLFSLAPLFLIVISLATIFFGESQVRQHILLQVGALTGPAGANAVNGIIEHEPHLSSNVLISALGLIFIFLGATGVFGQLKISLDQIWDVQPKKERTLWTLVEHNFLPFTMVLGTGFLLLVSLVLSSFITFISHYIASIIPSPFLVLEGLNFVLALTAVTFLFALMYKFLPDANVKWRDVWGGAVVAALLFTIGKFLIGIYIGNSNLLSAYGAAGSVVVILIWVYYSAQILFFGAEFTKVYAHTYGSKKSKKS